MKVSNYDIARDSAKLLFLKYDQKKIIRKFALDYDAGYLYVDFVNRRYRINRETGTVEWSEDAYQTVQEADFNVTMTIFDILCYSKDGCQASGRYDGVKNLKGTGYTGDPGSSIYHSSLHKFDHQMAALSSACEKLGGEAYVVGDVAYIIPIFHDLKMVFQFWESDEEFEAQMKMKWDENVLDYMHFETVHYAMGHVLKRLEELL